MGISSIPGFDSINTALIMTDSDGCIVYKNKAARKRYTRPAVGASLVRLISDDTRDDFTALMSDGIPAVVQMRVSESQTSYRAAAGPFTYCGTDYLMLVFIDTLHLDPSQLLFADLYRQLPAFWDKLKVILELISENTAGSKGSAALGRFRSRMNELLNITAGRYLSNILCQTSEGDITLKQLICILSDAAGLVPARYDCNLRFDRTGLDDKQLCSISLNLIKYLSSFFLSLLPMLGISFDRYVTVTFETDARPGILVTHMKTRIPTCELNCTGTSDFERLAELYPNEGLNLFIYHAMSRLLDFGAEYSITGSEGHTFITFSVSLDQTTANILLLRSPDDDEGCNAKLASQPMELMYDLLSGLENSDSENI